ncbi:hypothetical protein Tco_0232956 [Tanacetum coccineum]
MMNTSHSIGIDTNVTQTEDVNMLDQNATNVTANSETNINSHIIDVHVDVEELARATMAKLDRIWVDLVRKEIKSLLDIIDAAEHRIESDTNVVEGLMKLILQNMKDTTKLTIKSFLLLWNLIRFSTADVDTDIEPWDPYFTVDSFASITNPHAYYNMDKVKKIAVEVLQNGRSYKEKDFAQTFVSINNFQVGYVDPTQYPRYQNYSFVRRDWLIAVNSNTVITENLFSEETGFQMHTWLPFIRSFVEDKTHRKMLIDTIGRVIRGGLKQPKGVNTCEIWLRDLTGVEIKFVSIHMLRKVAIRLAKVIFNAGYNITYTVLCLCKPNQVTKEDKIIGSSNPPVIHTSDSQVGHLKFKRRRLMKNGSFVHKNVVENISLDDERTLSNEKSVSDDQSPIILMRSTKINNTIDDCDTNEQAHVAVENTNMNNSYDDVGIDIQHSESVSYEEMDEEDDLEDFINDDDADD